MLIPSSPAKQLAMLSWAKASVLTQKMPFRLKTGLSALRRFMQTSRVGGSSVTEQIADAVKPQRPAGPAVVTMLTAAPTRRMPA